MASDANMANKEFLPFSCLRILRACLIGKNHVRLGKINKKFKINTI